MKKLPTFIITATFSLCLLFTINESADAQNVGDSMLVANPGDITFGAGITRGSSTGLLENAETGLTGQIYFTVTEEFRGGIDFTYYLIGERDLSANELNLNVHYFVRNRSSLAFYGLGGINISNTSGSDELWRVEREVGDPNTRRLGLNIGGGLEFRISNLSIFGEPKLTLLGFNQFAFTGGVRYVL
jgi:hypothetical protein